MFQSLSSSFKQVYAKYERQVLIAAFVLGFLFDMALLHRIDEPMVIFQQALYLLISCALISVDLLDPIQKVQSPAFLRKVWKYREFLLHFLLGTLLNSYTIFYFKSASGLTSYLFIFVLVAALAFSEFKNFGKSQTQVHMMLWSLCLISYLQSLLPILFGSMGVLLFLTSGLASVLIFLAYYKIMKTRLAAHPMLLRKHVLYPYFGTQFIFTALYFLHAIPPVPLSALYMGIYHSAEKKDGQYRLSYSRPQYLFWQHGDELFEARAGDALVAFIQVYLPSRFEEKLLIQWSLYDSKQGWQLQDSVPLVLTGGREEGYRAVIKKSNYSAGDWRVQIITTDNHEVGRLGFLVIPDVKVSERDFHVDVR